MMRVELDEVIETLTQIIKATFVTQSVSEQYDRDGKLFGSTVTSRTPEPSEILNAIDLVNRMSGLY